MDDDSKQAWMKVGLHFAAAGDKLRSHAKAASEAAKSERGGDGPDQAAVVDALNTLGKAVNQAVSSLSGAVKDPEVRDNLTEALNSMGEAMNVTFADVGDKVGDKVADVGSKVSDKMKDTFGKKPRPAESTGRGSGRAGPGRADAGVRGRRARGADGQGDDGERRPVAGRGREHRRVGADHVLHLVEPLPAVEHARARIVAHASAAHDVAGHRRPRSGLVAERARDRWGRGPERVVGAGVPASPPRGAAPSARRTRSRGGAVSR